MKAYTTYQLRALLEEYCESGLSHLEQELAYSEVGAFINWIEENDDETV